MRKREEKKEIGPVIIGMMYTACLTPWLIPIVLFASALIRVTHSLGLDWNGMANELYSSRGPAESWGNKQERRTSVRYYVRCSSFDSCTGSDALLLLP